MCNPMIAGLALSTAGGLARGMTESNYRNALNSENKAAFNLSRQAREAERVRQGGYDQEGEATFTDTLGTFGRDAHDANASNRAAEFENLLADTPGAPDPTLPGFDGATGAVRNRIVREVNRAASEGRAHIQAMAKVGATRGVGGENARGMQGAGDFMSLLGGLRRGSLAVGQQEQTIEPAQVERGSNMFADLLSGAGGLASYGAGNGGFGGGGALPTVATINNPSWLFGGRP